MMNDYTTRIQWTCMKPMVLYGGSQPSYPVEKWKYSSKDPFIIQYCIFLVVSMLENHSCVVRNEQGSFSTKAHLDGSTRLQSLAFGLSSSSASQLKIICWWTISSRNRDVCRDSSKTCGLLIAAEHISRCQQVHRDLQHGISTIHSCAKDRIRYLIALIK